MAGSEAERDEAKRLILRMTNLDPTKRATMSEIVEDSYWVEVEKSSVTYGTSERV
jgi:hypothetical protein